MNAAFIEEARRLYLDAFPPEERRPWAQIEAGGVPGPVLHVFADDSGAFAGFMTVWMFPDFRYVEHFATVPALRGQGVGGRLMREFIESSPEPVVLEAERAGANDMAARRIAFYGRCGLAALDFDYIQPSYGPGLPEVPLLLMCSDAHADGRAVASVLYRHVYASEREP